MKASEVVKELTALIAEKGDRDVVVYDSDGESFEFVPAFAAVSMTKENEKTFALLSSDVHGMIMNDDEEETLPLPFENKSQAL